MTATYNCIQWINNMQIRWTIIRSSAAAVLILCSKTFVHRYITATLKWSTKAGGLGNKFSIQVSYQVQPSKSCIHQCNQCLSFQTYKISKTMSWFINCNDHPIYCLTMDKNALQKLLSIFCKCVHPRTMPIRCYSTCYSTDVPVYSNTLCVVKPNSTYLAQSFTNSVAYSGGCLRKPDKHSVPAISAK